MTVVIKRGDAFLLTMMMIMQVILGFSGFLVFAALRLVDLSACSLLGFWVFWLLQLLGFLAFFLAGVSPTPAVVKPFTTMFALGEGCEDHFVCKWGWCPSPTLPFFKAIHTYGKRHVITMGLQPLNPPACLRMGGCDPPTQPLVKSNSGFYK